MKKQTMSKRLFATVLAGMMIASSSAVFAETVVYEDSFETSNGKDTGLYVSMPEILTYGPNILSIDWTKSNLYVDNTAVKGPNVNNTVKSVSQEVTRGGEGDYALKFTTSKGDRSAYPYFTIHSGALEAGIYEVEGWFYTDVDGMNIDICTDGYNLSAAATAYGQFAEYGSEKGTSTLNANEWTYIKARYSLTATNTADFTLRFIPNNGWKKSDENMGVLYMDDVKLRKITNAALTTASNQAGMPVFDTSSISGQVAEARVFAANTTSSAKSFQLITAVYDADGRLSKVIGNEAITVSANTKKQPYTVGFSVPELEDGQYVKTFTWDSLESLISLQKAKNYSDANYICSLSRNTNIPNTNAWAIQASDYSNAHGTDRIVSGIAKTGVNALLISGAGSAGTTQTFHNIPVTNGHTYKIEYYVNYRNYCQDRADCIIGYLREDMNRGGSTVTPDSTSYNGVSANAQAAILHPTSSSAKTAANITAGEWIKVEITFTVDNDNTNWCYEFTSAPNRQLSTTYRDQMYVDDFKVTDITA